MKVSLSELKLAFESILLAVEADCGSVLQLNQDYYWAVSADATYAVPKCLDIEKDCTIGQISFDLDIIDSIVRSELHAVF